MINEPTTEELEQSYLAKSFAEIKNILENGSGSKAAIAVVEMMEAGVEMALFKHKVRGDSWIEELPVEACVTLSKAKAARVILMFKALAAGTITKAKAIEEFHDESVYVAVFMAFARYHVKHGKSPFSGDQR